MTAAIMYQLQASKKQAIWNFCKKDWRKNLSDLHIHKAHKIWFEIHRRENKSFSGATLDNILKKLLFSKNYTGFCPRIFF